MAQCIDNYWPTSKSLPCGIIKQCALIVQAPKKLTVSVLLNLQTQQLCIIVAVARLAEDHYKKTSQLSYTQLFLQSVV